MTTTYTVGVGKDYSSISSAIAAIPYTVDDDYIIEVDPGTYGPISISKFITTYSITIKGQLGNPDAVVIENIGITASIQCENVTIQDVHFNSLWDNFSVLLGVIIGPSFSGESSDHNILLDRCKFTKYGGYITLSSGFGGVTVRNSLFELNQDYNGALHVSATNGSGLLTLYNNTIITSVDTVFGGGPNSQAILKNNIFYSTSSSPYVVFYNTNSTTLTSDYNVFSAPNSTGRWYYDGGTYTTFESFQSGTGLDSNSAFVTDLNFIDFDNWDYHLDLGSPALNTGTDLSSDGVTTDYSNNLRPLGSAYEIGAFEMGELSPNPLLCWQLKAKYKNSNRFFTLEGPDSYPSNINLPSNIDLNTLSVIEDGQQII